MKKLLPFLLLLSMANGWLFSQTYTLTGNTITVQLGDAAPPMGFTPSGAASWVTAVASGVPTYSTLYTSASPIGTYSFTISTAGMTAQSGYSFATVNGSIVVIAKTSPLTGAQTNTSPILPPPGAIQNMTISNGTCSGMVGDGVTLNDTALDCWLHTGRTSSGTYTRSPKQLYLPTGKYALSATHQTYACCTVITGDGPSSTFYLAPNSSGFSVPSPSITDSPFIWISGRDPDEGFNYFLYNVGIEIGPGNTSARALVWQANNSNAARNIDIWFDDGGGNGSAGLFLNRSFPGPSQFSNIRIFGGDYGVQASQHPEYQVSMEYITVENQRTAGLVNANTPLFVKGLFSSQSRAGVVAWSAVAAAPGVLYDALLVNGSAAYAIVNANATGTFTAHNITQGGYTTGVISDANGPKTVAGTSMATTATGVYYSGTAKTLFSAVSPQTVGIVPQDTPMPSDPASGSWARFPNCVSGWQAALNAATSTTYYADVSTNYNQTTCLADATNIANFTGSYFNMPAGAVPITIPDGVNHLYLNGFVLNPASGVSIQWIVAGNSSTPLIIEGQQGGQNGIYHTGSRKVVVKDQSSAYSCANGAGDTFWDGTQWGIPIYPNAYTTIPANPLGGFVTFCNGQNVFVRSGDNEDRNTAFAASTVALDNSTSPATLTVTLPASVDPWLYAPTGGYPGSIVALLGMTTATWLNGTVAEIQSVGTNTFTAKWYGTHADYPAAADTGSYQAYNNKIACAGCTLWSLGYKTERGGGLQLFLKNARAEIWGGFNYIIGTTVPPTTGAVYGFDNSDVMFSSYAFYGGSAAMWPNWTLETRGASTLLYAMPGGSTGTANQFSQFFYSIGNPFRNSIKARAFKGRKLQ